MPDLREAFKKGIISWKRGAFAPKKESRAGWPEEILRKRKPENKEGTGKTPFLPGIRTRPGDV
jgi:hypothetical protein